MNEQITKLLQPMEKHPSASREALERLRQYVGADLPADYLAFLHWSNGAAGKMHPHLPLLRERGATGFDHLLFSAEEILEYAESTKDFAQEWRELWPGYLVISLTTTHPGFLDVRSRDPQTMAFALGHRDAENDEGTIVYQTSSFLDFLEHLSTTLVDLTKVDLRGANLSGAHLFGCVLHYASLTGADLTGADLRQASLEGADLTDAKLGNIRLAGAGYDDDTRWPKGFNPRQHGASTPWDDGLE